MEFVKIKFKAQTIVGAEVGVLHGKHALNILRYMPNVKLLYLVDPFKFYPEYKEGDGYTIEPAKKPTLERLVPYKARIKWVFKFFEECTIKEIDQPLDFIYIDGNHAYEYVKKDVALAVQFVKKGGVVAGHDWGASGVIKAVTEYCQSKKVKKYIATNENWQGYDWWFINP